MAAWTQDIALVPPAALGPLVEDFQSLVDAADDVLDTAGDALDAASALVAGTASPLAALVTAQVVAAKGMLNDIFGAGVYPITVHPWMPGVGFGHRPGAVRSALQAGTVVPFEAGDLLSVSLSFPNAVQAIVNSFDDQGDKNRPQFSNAAEVSMIVLIAGAPSPSIFKDVIAAIRALVDTSGFRLAERRVLAALRQNTDRFTLPAASKLPDWDPPTTVLSVFPGLQPLYEALKAAIATLEGYARGAVAAVDAAGDLIDAKRAQLTALKARLDAAAALFAGGLAGAGLYAVRIEGMGGNKFLQDELRAATGAPGHELSLCAGMAWVASPAELQAAGDILGL